MKTNITTNSSLCVNQKWLHHW